MALTISDDIDLIDALIKRAIECAQGAQTAYDHGDLDLAMAYTKEGRDHLRDATDMMGDYLGIDAADARRA